MAPSPSAKTAVVEAIKQEIAERRSFLEEKQQEKIAQKTKWQGLTVSGIEVLPVHSSREKELLVYPIHIFLFI